MKISASLLITIFTMFFSFSNQAISEKVPIMDFKPKWEVGMNWLIETEHETEPPSVPKKELKKWKPQKYHILEQYMIEKKIDVEGELCFQVKIGTASIDGNTYSSKWISRLYFRSEDFTLKKVQECLINKNVEKEIRYHLYSRGPIEDPVLHMMFPYFDPNTADYNPRKKLVAGTLISESNHLYQKAEADTDVIVNNKEQKTLKIVLQDKDKDDGDVKKESVQTWVKGLPWWISSTYREERSGGVKPLIITSKLISVNGRPVDIKPK